MAKRAIPFLLILMACRTIAVADDAADTEIKNDVLFRALVDELERGRSGLKIEDLERPYFIEYALLDINNIDVQAALGAVFSRNENRARRLRTDIRVGSYELDNTNYQGDFAGFFGGGFGGGAPIPIEDDYDAIRQAVWWTTDREYKSVTEAFEKKKAFMEGKIIEDKPSDFSQEKPSVAFEARATLALPMDKFESLAVAVSKIFREHPEIKSSSASVNGTAWNRYLVNSEGTRLRTAHTSCKLVINATIQADDGMELSDSITAGARSFEKLPSLDELAKDCAEMVDRLKKLRDAPKLDSYSGPVLFDPAPAASIFSSKFARRFSGGQRALGGRRRADNLENKLNKRILPRFVNVVDDPTLETLQDEPVLGHYRYDDQGVPAQKVQLVEAGKLRNLLMARNPSKDFDRSNGHGRGWYRIDAGHACLVLSTDDGTEKDAMKQELLDACEDEDLEFGIRIASLGRVAAPGGFSQFGFPGMGGQRGGSMPLAMYKVFPDGREELVRGAEFAEISPKAFKRIIAAGDKLYVSNKSGIQGKTVAAPALLFEELDLAEIDRDFDKPPVLPSPLAR